VGKVPICTIALDSAGTFGFRVNFAGRPPHDVMSSFPSPEATLNWLDLHRERIWIEPSDADESKLLISRAYLPGANIAGT
jgi:hypothetical protein